MIDSNTIISGREQPEELESPIYAETDVRDRKLTLRNDLRVSLQHTAGKPFVMISDSLRGQFYRLGPDEWAHAKRLDGTKTVVNVGRALVLESGNEETMKQLLRVANWLTQVELVESVDRPTPPRAKDSDHTATTSTDWREHLRRSANWGKWNPLFITIPLPNPQRLLAHLYPYTAWFFSLAFFWCWLLVVTAGACAICWQWDRFWDSSDQIFALENGVYLFLTWLVLKTLHEVGHAISCMRLGGSVTRCGLMFIVFSPIAWVDVTSAWSFRSKWQRIFVSAAGMYVELFLAGAAAICFVMSDNPMVAMTSRNIVVSASLTTLLFNLNFLMRFDGYYMLSDLLGIHNLYSAGQQRMQFFWRNYVLNIDTPCPEPFGWTGRLVAVYAVASTIWRLMFYIGIVIVAAHLFHGAGVVLALFCGLVWFALPAARFCLTMWHGDDAAAPDRKRVASLAGLAIVATLLLLSAPWPGATVAHGVVEFTHPTSGSTRHTSPTVRAEVSGFVRDVKVTSGQTVHRGDLLLVLENDDLVAELADLEQQLQIEQQRMRVALSQNEVANAQAIGERIKSLDEQRVLLHEQVSALQVCAPRDGSVVGRDLDAMIGNFVRSGDELMVVGNPAEKEIHVAIPETEIEAFREYGVAEVQIAILGHGLAQGKGVLQNVYPSAAKHLIHTALAATQGGPLPVQARGDQQDGMELVTPHFEGIIQLPPDVSVELFAGEVCRVSLGRGRQSVLHKLQQLGREYLAKKVAGV